MGKIERLDSAVVYETPWMKIRADNVRFADGSTGVYSLVDKADFALVMAESAGGFWLVEQFRYPVGRRLWEFPQGGWATGKSGTREELAAAELREETGITAADLRHLGHLYAAVGHSNQGYDIFHATDLTMGEPERESSEHDMVHGWFSESEIRAMIKRGEFVDAHSIAALALLDLDRLELDRT